MKRIISMLLALTMVFSVASVSFAVEEPMITSSRPVLISENPFADDSIKVYLNNDVIDFTDENGNVVEPQLINDRTMVPMRKIFEVFEADVKWEGTTETVTAVTDEKTIVLQINNNVAKIINSSGETEEITLDSAPVIVNGRTLVPVRFIAESLELKVGWDGTTNSVIIIDVEGLLEIVKENAPTFYEYLTNEYTIPESFAGTADMIFNVKYTNSQDKTQNTNAKFVIDATVNAMNELYEVKMNSKTTGKGPLYQEIKDAKFDKFDINMVMDVENMVGYIKSSLLESEIEDKWLKVKEEAVGVEAVLTNPEQYTTKELVNTLLDEVEMTPTTYSALEILTEMACKFVSDDYFKVSGRTTKTYSYEISLDDLNGLLQEMGMPIDLKDFAKSGKITFSSKYENGVNVSSTFKIAAVVTLESETLDLSFEGTSKTSKINQKISINLPAEKDVVEY